MEDLNNIMPWSKYKAKNKLPNNIISVYAYLQNFAGFTGITIYRNKDITPFEQAKRIMSATEVAGNKEVSQVVYYTLNNKGRLNSLRQIVIFCRYA